MIKLFIENVMHADFNFAHIEWSFFAIYCYFYDQSNNFVEQVAWKKVALLFNGATSASLCAYCFCAGISMPCIETPYRPIDKKCNFFLAPDFINSTISQYDGEYGQWITMCVRKLWMHYILNENFWVNVCRVIIRMSHRNLVCWLDLQLFVRVFQDVVLDKHVLYLRNQGLFRLWKWIWNFNIRANVWRNGYRESILILEHSPWFDSGWAVVWEQNFKQAFSAWSRQPCPPDFK